MYSLIRKAIYAVLVVLEDSLVFYHTALFSWLLDVQRIQRVR